MSNQTLENYITLCDPPIKKINDCIHGFIYLSEFATRVIDTKFFQRLRDLSQLGTCKYVYPNANHTRFEHSIGTYCVATKLLEKLPLQTNQQIDDYMSSIPELKEYYKKIYDDQVHPLDVYVCELIKIAALCHDLGHGPFSHVYDDVFLPKVGKDTSFCATHEERSGVILKMIIHNDDILKSLISDDEIQFMINIINPTKEHTGFIYQIVSNTVTSLDVDKFDYLQRDIYMLNFQAKINVATLIEQVKIIDNNFVYPEQATNDIINLFTTRHRLHIQVYCHKATISTQLMMVEIFSLLDDILGLSDSINDMNKFCKMTEGYILNSVKLLENNKEWLTPEQLSKFNIAQKLIENLELRQLYSMIYHFVSKDCIDPSKYFENFDDRDKILFFQNKIGFVSGNKPNPLDSIYVYKTKYSNVSTKLIAHKKNKEEITLLMPKIYQEYIITIYYKDKHNKKRINELKDYCHDIFHK
jgi:HD superfamily phosphohydrolase